MSFKKEASSNRLPLARCGKSSTRPPCPRSHDAAVAVLELPGQASRPVECLSHGHGANAQP
eukprot:3140857-Pyramimonas_sp.AAC.1